MSTATEPYEFDPSVPGESLVGDWDEPTIGITDEESQPEREGFRIKDLGQAIHFLGRLKEKEGEKQGIIEAAGQNIEIYLAELEMYTEPIRAAVSELNTWRNNEVDKVQKECDFYAGALETFHRQQYALDGKKTVSLPGGMLKRREGTASIEVTDEESFIPFAALNADSLLAVPKPTVSKTAVKEAIKSGDLVVKKDGSLCLADGESVPGIKLERREPTYKVELDGGEG